MVDLHNDLRLALRAFTETVCQRLSGQPIPMASVQVMRYTADGSGRGEPRLTPAPASLVGVMQQEWQLWSTFEKLRNAIEDDPDAANFLYSDALGNPMKGNEPWIITMMAARFIHDYLAAVNEAHVIFRETVFDELWSQFSQTIQTGLSNVAWWAPIYNAQWIGEPFEIPINTSSALLEPPPTVMVELLAHRRLTSMIDAQAWLKTNDRISLKQVVAEPPIRFARNVASAARLVSGGHAFARDITMLPFPGVPGVYGQFGGWRGFPPAWWGGAMSALNVGIEGHLQNRVAQLERLGEPFDVVLDRYESAVTKLVGDERLIDATIALEALLVGGSGSSTEVTFRFALTGAWLLADAPSTRPEIYRLLYELYGRRSDIVHGNLGRKRELPPNAQEFAVDLLRTLLLRVLDSGWNWDQWIKFRRGLILGLEAANPEEVQTDSHAT